VHHDCQIADNAVLAILWKLFTKCSKGGLKVKSCK